MAAHSSVLAWRIPGMAEPGGLPSMGSHRVGRNRSDSAAADCLLVKNKNQTVSERILNPPCCGSLGKRREPWLVFGSTFLEAEPPLVVEGIEAEESQLRAARHAGHESALAIYVHKDRTMSRCVSQCGCWPPTPLGRRSGWGQDPGALCSRKTGRGGLQIDTFRGRLGKSNQYVL